MGKYAIIIVFALTFALITYAHGLRKVLLMSTNQLVEGHSFHQAQNIAQSTAMVAYNRILDDELIPEPNTVQYFSDNGGTGFEQWNDLNGSFRLRIENQGDDRLVIESFGRFDNQEYLVTVVLDRNDPVWQPDLSHAVFAGSSIFMAGSSEIIGDVGTNAITAGAVTFTGNPKITGSLSVGPGGDPYEVLDAPPWQGTNSWVQGGVSSSSQELEFDLPPFINFPPQNNPHPSITLSGASSTNIPASTITGSYIPEINILSDNTLTIDTQGQDITLHVGNLNLQQGHINFTGGGKVTLKVENNITVNGSSTLNSNGDTGDLLTYYKGSNELNFAGSTTFNSDLFAESADVTLSGSGGLQGHVITGGSNVTISGAAEAVSRVIYAPNADVELTGSGSVRGSVVANTFSAQGAATVTFEADHTTELPDIKLEDGGVSILSWN